jgi:hypothetical protein
MASLCSFYILSTLWNRLYSNGSCTEDFVENIQVVASSISLAELCATDNMLDIMHMFVSQEMRFCTVFNCGE